MSTLTATSPSSSTKLPLRSSTLAPTWQGWISRLSSLDASRPLNQDEITFLTAPNSSFQVPDRTSEPQDWTQYHYFLLAQLLFSFRLQNQAIMPILQWAQNIDLPESFIAAAQKSVEGAIQSAKINQVQQNPQPTSQSNSQSYSSNQSTDIAPSLSLDQRGQLMAEAYAYQGKEGIRFLNADESGPRYYNFLFQKPPSLTYRSLTSNLADVLSHAHFDPTADYLSRLLPGNRFELQIPKPRSLWKTLHLIDTLLKVSNPQLVNQLSTMPDKQIAFQKAMNWVHEWMIQNYGINSKINSNGIRLPFGFYGNELYNADLTTGGLIVGQTDSGKSVAILQLLASYFLSGTPHERRIVLMDFKDGLTLGRLDTSPYLWINPATRSPQPSISPAPGFDAVEEAISIFQMLRIEFENRTTLFKKHRIQNIWEYNQLFPDAPMPTILIFIEEFLRLYSLAKAQRKDDELNEIMLDILTLWRCTGIVSILSTQYAKADTGLPPEVRGNFGSAIAYRCSESAAKLAFGDNDSSWSRATSRLILKAGDCIVKNNDTFSHIQSLNLSGATLENILEFLESVYF